MKRRSMLTLLGTLALGSSALLRRAFAASAPEMLGPKMAAVADTMFPGGDGLPGASALGLHEKVLAVADFDALIRKGLAWLDRYAASRGVTDFVALDEPGRLAALDAAFGSTDDGIRTFVFALRQQLGLTYYTDPAVKKAFAYAGPPQPDGFADFQERPA